MPSFGIGINPHKRDNGNVRGSTKPIACMAWYAPDHAPVPLLFKFEGHDGVIQTVDSINILHMDCKHYDGDKVYEYACDAVFDGIVYWFKLLFYVLSCRWTMVI